MALHLIQEAINYIEEHILDDITYADVASGVGLSGYDFHRMFSFVTGMTATEYIRRRRLTLAALDLQSSGISVIDVAFKYGYESPDSFSKAFSRFHGSTPRQAKRKGARLCLFNPLAIKITFEGGSMMDYRIEHKEGQCFLAMVKAFPNEASGNENYSGIPDFWTECGKSGRLWAMQRLRAEGKRDLYGLCAPLKENQTHFNYGIGILLDEGTDKAESQRLLKEGFTIWETAPADYAVFKCFGSDGACIGETWSKFFKEFSPQTGWTQTDDTDYEIYFDHGEDGLFCELWIPIKKR